MFIQPSKITFRIPKWIETYSQSYLTTIDLTKRMQFVINASKKNVEERTGGPFAAAIFESDSGNLVSLGVNLVTTEGMSMLHAEIVAIAIAQQKLKTYDLGGQTVVNHELIASAEPCAMCFGAIPWSGVRRVITAAKDEDVRSIGFDEGPKPANWVESLNKRGIEVVENIGREKALAVLRLYMRSEGHIYNSREIQQ